MKTNKKNIISLSITLQVFMLLLAAVTIPVTAIEDPVVPQLPLILSGNVEINGEPAAVGTVITAELNNEIIASTEVDCEGICGNCPANRLSIGCDADDFANLKFYVDGIEADVDMDIIKAASYGDVEETYFIATASSGSTRSTGGSGHGLSPSSTSTTSDDGLEDAISETTPEKTSSGTTLESTRTDQSSESSEEAPAPESSIGTVGLIAIGGIVLLGAILAYRYGLKSS